MIPVIVKRIAALKLDRQVMVEVGGKKYQLPLVPEPCPIKPPDSIDLLAKQLEQRDAGYYAALNLANDSTMHLVGMLSNVNATLGMMKERQEEIIKGINEVSSALTAPVKPIYDKQGN